MNLAERFFAYAAAFEQTYEDDDWSRLDPYFTIDAIYEVDGFGPPCKISGRADIFAGIRKSLDGFDRRCSSRTIALVGGPQVDGNRLELAWKVTYTKPQAPPYVLEGTSIAQYAGDRIEHLTDRYAAGVAAKASAWLRAYAPDFDPSYV